MGSLPKRALSSKPISSADSASPTAIQKMSDIAVAWSEPRLTSGLSEQDANPQRKGIVTNLKVGFKSFVPVGLVMFAQ